MTIKSPPSHQELYQCQIDNIYDDDIKKIIITLWESLKGSRTLNSMNKNRRDNMFEFVEIIKLKNISECNWNLFCDIVCSKIEFGYFCSKFLYALLDQNLYAGPYKEQLQTIKEVFNLGNSFKNEVFKKIFINNIDRLFYYKPYADYRGRSYIYLNHPSETIREVLKAFYLSDRPDSASYKMEFYDFFDDSLGELTLKVTLQSDFNYATYITQLNFFKSAPLNHKKIVIQTLNRFYVYLHDELKIPVFKNSDNLDVTFLKRDDLAQKIMDDFEMIYYSPLAKVPLSDRWILHINGHEKTTTKLRSTTTKAFDFLKVNSKYYRQLLKSYIWEDGSKNFNSKYERYIMLSELLNFLTTCKKEKGYPNPIESIITIQEANLIKEYLKTVKNSVLTMNSHLSALREFLKIQQKDNTIQLELLVLNYLSQFAETKQNKAHAIPDEDLQKINMQMKKHLNDSLLHTLCYAIFHLCIQTEFRISQICHLKVDCITDTMKNNQFMIKTHSKTSNGQEYSAIISDLTKRHIDDIIKQTASIREECNDENVKDYLFLYKTQQNHYKPVDSRDFKKILDMCCSEAKITSYSANNLRDTHMTKAEEYRMRNNKSDSVLQVLSGHKRIDTTRNHYIETELTKMLESTYGIIIGDVNIEGEIVSKISPSLSTKKEKVVENGCGYCKQDTCSILTEISCLMCKEFITSINHEKHFKIMLNHIDENIKNAPTPHDKDDLINIKRLYSAYLREIILLKEGEKSE